MIEKWFIKNLTNKRISVLDMIIPPLKRIKLKDSIDFVKDLSTDSIKDLLQNSKIQIYRYVDNVLADEYNSNNYNEITLARQKDVDDAVGGSGKTGSLLISSSQEVDLSVSTYIFNFGEYALAPTATLPSAEDHLGETVIFINPKGLTEYMPIVHGNMYGSDNYYSMPQYSTVTFVAAAAVDGTPASWYIVNVYED